MACAASATRKRVVKLTDAMAQLIGNQPFHGFTFDGQRYDCGNKAGYIQPIWRSP